MAEGNGLNTGVAGPVARVEDLLPVKSRVSWGAILAGAVLALALAFLFSLFGSAFGLSMRDRMSGDQLSTAAAIWAVVTTVLALFLGGLAATKLAVGENMWEAYVHGLLVWGATFALILGLMGMGVNSGFASLASVAGTSRLASADVSQTSLGQFTADKDWETKAREAGVEQEKIDKIKKNAKEAQDAAIKTAANLAADPATQNVAMNNLAQASWWTLLGTILSMLAAVAGAALGCGPSFRIVGLPVRKTTTTETRLPVRS